MGTESCKSFGGGAGLRYDRYRTMLFTPEEGWKEMKWGRIFKASDRICAPRRITLRGSTYVARLGPHAAFLAELEKRLIDLLQKIIIADGAAWIWNYFEAFAPTAIQILDFYPAVEKLSSFARVLFRKERRRKQWRARQIQLLRADGVESVIAELEPLLCRGRAKQAREQLINYYRRKTEVIRNLRVSRVSNRFRGYRVGA